MFAASRWQERGGKNNDDHSDGKKIKQNYSCTREGVSTVVITMRARKLFPFLLGVTFDFLGTAVLQKL